MAPRRRLQFVPTIFLFLTACCAQATVDDTFLQDDEDVMLRASFILQLRTRSQDYCTPINNPSVLLHFNDALQQAIIAGINEDCDNCGFSSKNFANEIFSCGEAAEDTSDHNQILLSYGATIRDWDSPDQPASDILQAIRRRYENSTTPLSLSMEELPSGSLEGVSLSLSVVDVSTDLVIVAVGSGGGQVVETTEKEQLLENVTVTMTTTAASTMRHPEGLGVVDGSERLGAVVGMVLTLSALAFAMQFY